MHLVDGPDPAESLPQSYDLAFSKAWVWSVPPCLRGDDPTMQDRITRLASWERFVPRQVAPALAHQWWHLFEWAEGRVPAGR